jgi:hypothetical protein
MIAATFHGPNYNSPNNDESTIEVFENNGHVITALFERYDANGRRPLPVRFLNGNFGDIIFPAVTPGHYFQCWEITDIEDESDAEGQVLEALSRVHIGSPDWTMHLRPDERRGTGVMILVEKR